MGSVCFQLGGDMGPVIAPRHVTPGVGHTATLLHQRAILRVATKTQMPRKEARETAEILSLRAGAGAGPGGAGTARKGGLKVW